QRAARGGAVADRGGGQRSRLARRQLRTAGHRIGKYPGAIEGTIWRPRGLGTGEQRWSSGNRDASLPHCAMKIKAVIVDDESLARAWLRRLWSHEADVEIVAECADGVAALEAVKEHQPDLLLLDVQMPEMDGFGVV